MKRPFDIGGKDPAARREKERRPLAMIAIIAKKENKGRNEAPDRAPAPTSAPAPEPEGEARPAAPSSSPDSISPEEAQFHDQSQSCATCEYFDDSDGVGVCTMGVQVDFNESIPSQSWCKYWESGSGPGEDSETPEEEAAETLAPVA